MPVPSIFDKAILTAAETVLKQIDSNLDLMEQRSILCFYFLKEQVIFLLNNLASLSPFKMSSFTRKPAKSTFSSPKNFPSEQLLHPNVSYQCNVQLVW